MSIDSIERFNTLYNIWLEETDPVKQEDLLAKMRKYLNFISN